MTITIAPGANPNTSMVQRARDTEQFVFEQYGITDIVVYDDCIVYDSNVDSDKALFNKPITEWRHEKK